MKTNTAPTSVSPLRGLKIAALVIGSGLVLAGCSGNPPTQQLATSHLAVKSAVYSGATEYAPAELQTAQNKLRQAELAVHDDNYQEAKRLAEQAEWDARVAERKAEANKAQRALQQAQKGNKAKPLYHSM